MILIFIKERGDLSENRLETRFGRCENVFLDPFQGKQVVFLLDIRLTCPKFAEKQKPA